MKTDYIADFKALAREFELDISAKRVKIDGHREFELLSSPFSSNAGFVYPETGDYASKGGTFTALLRYFCDNNRYSNEFIFKRLEKPDVKISENMDFRIPIFKPQGNRRFKKAVILLHGLNERRWEKYLPWALRIMEETDAPVILFPIAFHMNRAPESWGSPRGMMKVAEERRRFVPADCETSFLNAALSHRIQFAPHRFFSSGMQTYYDIINMVNQTRLGDYPFLDRGCSFDFFGYSIGASLAEVLVTGSSAGYFGESKAFLFCGGAALDTAEPVSKTIIDSEAYTELFAWLAGLFESVTDMSRRFREIFLQELPEVLSFKSFLFYDRMQSFRESALRIASERIRQVSLAKDRVFSPESNLRTLGGLRGDTGIRAESLDFPFDYRHEEPFPLDERNCGPVNSAFEEIFSRVTNFLTSPA